MVNDSNQEPNEQRVKAKLNLLNIFKKQGPHEQGLEKRIPPGQRVTTGFPVLDLGIKPDMNLSTWKLQIDGLVEKPLSLSLEDLKKLGTQNYTIDFHCVTSWSKLDTKWTGVPWPKIVDYVKPKSNWKHIIQYGKDGYSTNVPRADLERENVFLAFEYEGKPIPQEHGYIRLIIPHLYAWKTSKFLTRIEFTEKDAPGFWEVRGYNNHGDAFKEERYS